MFIDIGGRRAAQRIIIIKHDTRVGTCGLNTFNLFSRQVIIMQRPRAYNNTVAVTQRRARGSNLREKLCFIAVPYRFAPYFT